MAREGFHRQDDPFVAFAEPTVGMVEMALGNDDAARAHLMTADELGGRFDNLWLRSSARSQLASVEVQAGRLGEARALLTCSVEAGDDAELSTLTVTLSLVTAAQLALAEGDARGAAVALGAADGLRHRAGLKAWPSTRAREAELVAPPRMRLTLGLEEALAEGAQIATEEPSPSYAAAPRTLVRSRLRPPSSAAARPRSGGARWLRSGLARLRSLGRRRGSRLAGPRRPSGRRGGGASRRHLRRRGRRRNRARPPRPRPEVSGVVEVGGREPVRHSMRVAVLTLPEVPLDDGDNRSSWTATVCHLPGRLVRARRGRALAGAHTLRRMGAEVCALLFSDIEGSTTLSQRLGPEYVSVLSRHQQLIRSAVAANAGQERGTEGDSFFVTFPTAAEAVLAAVDAQRGLGVEPWPEGGVVKVRMGIHVGEITHTKAGIVGLAVHHAARCRCGRARRPSGGERGGAGGGR